MQEIEYIGKTAGDIITSNIEAQKIRETYNSVSYTNISELGEDLQEGLILHGLRIDPNLDIPTDVDFDVDNLLVEDPDSITILGPGPIMDGINPFFPYITQIKAIGTSGYGEWAVATDRKYFPNFKGVILEYKTDSQPGQSEVQTIVLKKADLDSWMSAKDIKAEDTSHYTEQGEYVISGIFSHYVVSFSVLNPYEYTIQLPIPALDKAQASLQSNILTKIQRVALEKNTLTTISLGVPSSHNKSYIYYLELERTDSNQDPIGHIGLKWGSDIIRTPCFISVGQGYSEVQLQCITSSYNQVLNVYKVTPFFIQPTYQKTTYNTIFLPISNSEETQISQNASSNKVFKVSTFTSDFQELSNTTITLTNDTQGAAQFNAQPTPFYTKVNLDTYKAKWTRDQPGYLQIREVEGTEATLLRELMLLKGVDRIMP